MVTLSEENKKTLLAVFSKNMTAYRKAMRISQEDFGSLIGITRQTVSSIERGAYTLTWSIFLSSLLICAGNSQARQLILNSFAGDDTLMSYLDSIMLSPSSNNVYDFSKVAKQIEFASCVISTSDSHYSVVEADNQITELLNIAGDPNKSFLSIIEKEDVPIVEELLSEKIRKQMFVCAEFRITSEDGRPISVHCIIRRQKKLMKDGLFDVVMTQLTGEAVRKHTVSGMLDLIPVGVIVYECKNSGENIETDIYYTNDYFYDVIRHTKEQFASIHNNTFTNIVASEDIRRVNRLFANRRENPTSQMDVRINAFDGDAQWVHISSKVLLSSEDGTDVIALTLTNITNRVNNEMNMKYQLERYRKLDQVSEDLQFNYEVTEDIFTVPVMFGKFINKDNVIKHFIAEQKSKNYVHPDDMDIYRKQWSEALAHGGKSTSEYRIKLANNEYNWCRVILNCVTGDEGEISYVYGRIIIIDEEKRMQKEYKDSRMLINRLSSTDRLTGLYNRTAFRGRVSEILKECVDDSLHAIVYLDINNFSFINEKYGYPAGDKLLRDFSQMFLRKGKKCFGCRPHSDIFIVYINDEDKRSVLTKINNWSKLFVEHQTKTYPGVDVRVSAGVYFMASTSMDITQAINNANIARKQIKDNKLKNICIYTETLQERRMYEQEIVGGVADAIKDGKIEIFIQPKFEIDTGKCIGGEALARWKNEDGTYKNAQEFIPILENSGKITDLDFCVYTKVLQTIRRWKKYGMKPVPISINFSDRHNTYQNFDETVYRLCEQYGVDSKYIEIEVREKILATNVDNICDKVERLKNRGFKITLDGFGYGGSSLSFLLSAPVDTVKVDKDLWKNVQISEKERQFVHALASLIAAAKLDVVFEGVETEEQANLLKETGYNKAQGYLFAKPMTIEEFEKNYIK